MFRSIPVGGLLPFKPFARRATPPSIKLPSPRFNNGAPKPGRNGVLSCRLPSNHRLVALSSRAPARDLSPRTTLPQIHLYDQSKHYEIPRRLTRPGGISTPKPRLMTKMTNAGKDHRHIPLIGGGDYFFIAYRTARLNRTAGTGIGRGEKSIRKWEKCVTG